MLIQGSNRPIELEFDEPVAAVSALSVTIFDSTGKMALKKNADGLLVDGNKIFVPVTQEQTANMPKGKAKILVKWKSADGYVDFADEALIDVVSREDKGVVL